MEKRWQKNLTITKEQRKYIENNYGKMSIGELSKMLGLGYNKVHNNLRLLNKVKTRTARIIKMDGYFDIDKEWKQNYGSL